MKCKLVGMMCKPFVVWREVLGSDQKAYVSAFNLYFEGAGAKVEFAHGRL